MKDVVYVVLIPSTIYEDYHEIPYSYDKETALKYADKLGLIEDCVQPVSIEMFNKLKDYSEEVGELSIPSEIMLETVGDDKVYPLTEDDFQNVLSEIDDVSVRTATCLRDLYAVLNYYDSYEAKNLRKAIKKFVKSLGGKASKDDINIGEIIVNLANNIDFEKYVDANLKLKGESYI